MSPREIDVALCEALAQRTCDGDEEAWREIAEHMWPHFLGLVKGSRHMGGLARNDDHVHNVVANLVDKLGTDGGRAITSFPRWKSENAGKTFADWIRIVVSFTIKDYVRQQLGRSSGGGSKPDGEQLPSIKRLLNEFATSPAGEESFGSARPPMTAAQTARELLEWARKTLPTEQMAALSAWLDGASFEEIDAALAPPSAKQPEADAGRKTVRAAIATIRRRFGGDAPS
ncbi:MAG: hypothetical protein IPM79_20935 [Polyangiaceae bacterium]|nr:hypothetical protein [Polyangiaceae bacterium]MBK8940013.1 hypothetical protein [Polyangiaceae bacterium]